MFFKKFNNKEKITVITRCVGVTLLAFLLSKILVSTLGYAAASVSAIAGGSDYTFTDLYSQAGRAGAVRQLDTNQLILNISSSDRRDIAELLELLTTRNPRAIGIDVVFPEKMDSAIDNRLISALRRLPMAVVAESVDYSDGIAEVTEKSFFTDSIRGLSGGAVNLPAASARGTVREFPVGYPLASGDTLPGFATALALKADSGIAEKIRARGKALETIRFGAREYEIITPAELSENPSLADGKIVLIGTADDEADIHPTPVDRAMPGVLIHANSLSTILHNEYIQPIGTISDWAIAFLLTIGMLYFKMSLATKAAGLWMRIAQTVLLGATIWTGYSLFIDKGIMVNFAPSLTMVTFGFFALDIWNGAEIYLNDLINRLRGENREENSKLI